MRPILRHISLTILCAGLWAGPPAVAGNGLGSGAALLPASASSISSAASGVVNSGLATLPGEMQDGMADDLAVTPRPEWAMSRPQARLETLPQTRWQGRRGSDMWTRAALGALKTHGKRLVNTVPADIGNWCPAYPVASPEDRRAFWVGLMSTLAKHESTYRPDAVGGGGKWYGLLQILPATARGYGCQARSGGALKNGALNLSCATRIMAVTVPRDGVVSRGMRGVAADWGPFHSRAKREDMKRWMRKQPYCVGLTQRPKARPAGIGPARPVARPKDLATVMTVASVPQDDLVAIPEKEAAGAD
ncbi:transglycosylase SLT domain-containing protein [Roseovarius sp. C7]|uniref:transglycosylase SLT domain-containing protein n=1 Tax=Roseovarius sp. C7 TaxID=3398643 RepID=UPI0039F6BA8C